MRHGFRVCVSSTANGMGHGRTPWHRWRRSWPAAPRSADVKPLERRAPLDRTEAGPPKHFRKMARMYAVPGPDGTDVFRREGLAGLHVPHREQRAPEGEA